MKVAIEGCCHGELDQIYATLRQAEEKENVKVDLLLICGDFQAVRNEFDLESMAVPVKYRQMQTFHKYYSGEAVAPVLTVFIGGNHEAANHLWELPYGGWVAPNIYYMGFASVLTYGGLRFGGLSGIFKQQDFLKGHFEKPPFDQGTVRSFYHIREVDTFRLHQLAQPMDIFLSHDWPNGVAHHGNIDQLLSKKPFFREDIEKHALGSLPAMELLRKMRPLYWFSAHLHVRFSAVVHHDKSTAEDDQPTVTKFLALDKCLPRRNFLQIVDFPEASGERKLEHDAEWLCVLKKTCSLDQGSPRYQCMPSTDLWRYQPMPNEIASLRDSIDLTVPENFCRTCPVYEANQRRHPPPAQTGVNPQTQLFCSKLGIAPATGSVDSALSVASSNIGTRAGSSASDRAYSAATGAANTDEINLDDEEEEEDGDGSGTSGQCTAASAAFPTRQQKDFAGNSDEIALDDGGDDSDDDDDQHVSLFRNRQAQQQMSTSHAMIGPQPRSPGNTSTVPLNGQQAPSSYSPGHPASSSPPQRSASALSMPSADSKPDMAASKQETSPVAMSSAAPRRTAMFLPPPSSGGVTASTTAANTTAAIATATSSSATETGIGQQTDVHDRMPDAFKADEQPTPIGATSVSEGQRAVDVQAGVKSEDKVHPALKVEPRVLKRRNYALYAPESDGDEDQVADCEFCDTAYPSTEMRRKKAKE
ncbi:uncharacterized protein LOC135824589 [Sycon ciliatum]|uniref:uncharacterized protein LOC135824589 n=1 Tax=Sycon ciliatum TaxID=27933 RepID=UPI0031F6F8A7